MRSKILAISFLIFISGGMCFAHANEYSQEAGGEYASGLGNDHSEHDNMYAVSEEQSPGDEMIGHSLGRSEFIEEEPIHEEPEKKMDHQEGSHSKHVEIKISEHKLVSTSQKGYGSAAGITLVAGLTFGIVIMRRS